MPRKQRMARPGAALADPILPPLGMLSRRRVCDARLPVRHRSGSLDPPRRILLTLAARCRVHQLDDPSEVGCRGELYDDAALPRALVNAHAGVKTLT